MKILASASLAALILFGAATISNAEYHVQTGDTFYKIAEKHQMNLKDLISLNPHIKNPNNIQPNDYIIVRTKDAPAKDLVDYARSLQSVTAYVYGGQKAPYETDCSGWAQHVYKKFGVELPRISRDQAKTGLPVSFKELQLGDLMFFSTRADKRITHTGIYMGNDYWISNLNEKKDVEILSTWGSWAQDYFLWGTRHTIQPEAI
jgi:cell wall-associated NlpC family hydrolase